MIGSQENNVRGVVNFHIQFPQNIAEDEVQFTPCKAKSVQSASVQQSEV
jgi:hypothetical protein